jgi:hypothetical protein
MRFQPWPLALEDVEMINIPENLCVELTKIRRDSTLLDDFNTLPDMMDITQEHPQEATGAKPVKEKKKGEKEKWGPILVEPRPSRGVRDGRIVLEKAQDRKKKANLEIPKGIPQNSFDALSCTDIADISEIVVDTGIVLGRNPKEIENSLLEMLGKDNDRKLVFEKSCPDCQAIEVGF